ncbi:hypothetical protein TRVA0_004S04434 [Trichomonascus vanleenenianus]|uniref:polynucleotide 3'-phosphatase n=1 Tax=Trichomonascus vanleenenianus TaxID=2268995 RepID=UPI003ECB8264
MSKQAVKTITITSFFTAMPSTDARSKPFTWTLKHGTLLKGQYEPEVPPGEATLSSKVKIAAFDLDYTLVLPKNGSLHPKDGSDWKWTDDSVKAVLRYLVDSKQRVTSSLKPDHVDQIKNMLEVQEGDEYLLVVFSNQGGIPPRDTSKRYQYIKERVRQIATELEVPLTFYAACKDPTYKFRKPSRAMWHMLENDLNVEIDLARSFYVGDAAGRENDFSDSDKEFAAAIGIQFFTPEELFEAKN